MAKRHVFDMDWADAEEIVEMLKAKFPDLNPIDISFPKLLEMITALEGFTGKAEGNLEGKMERIVERWYEEWQYAHGR